MRASFDDLPEGSPLRKKMERLTDAEGNAPKYVWAYNPHDPWHPWNEMSLFEFVFWFFMIGLVGGLVVLFLTILLF